MPDYSDKELGYNDHGGPYDRGGADSYYRRSFDPHYWPDGTGFGVRIDITAVSYTHLTLPTKRIV